MQTAFIPTLKGDEADEFIRKADEVRSKTDETNQKVNQ
jgi:hypothetical protein